jgi:hypothetical protein
MPLEEAKFQLIESALKNQAGVEDIGTIEEGLDLTAIIKGAGAYTIGGLREAIRTRCSRDQVVKIWGLLKLEGSISKILREMKADYKSRHPEVSDETLAGMGESDILDDHFSSLAQLLPQQQPERPEPPPPLLGDLVISALKSRFAVVGLRDVNVDHYKQFHSDNMDNFNQREINLASVKAVVVEILDGLSVTDPEKSRILSEFSAENVETYCLNAEILMNTSDEEKVRKYLGYLSQSDSILPQEELAQQQPERPVPQPQEPVPPQKQRESIPAGLFAQSARQKRVTEAQKMRPLVLQAGGTPDLTTFHQQLDQAQKKTLPEGHPLATIASCFVGVKAGTPEGTALRVQEVQFDASTLLEPANVVYYKLTFGEDRGTATIYRQAHGGFEADQCVIRPGGVNAELDALESSILALKTMGYDTIELRSLRENRTITLGDGNQVSARALTYAFARRSGLRVTLDGQANPEVPDFQAAQGYYTQVGLPEAQPVLPVPPVDQREKPVAGQEPKRVAQRRIQGQQLARLRLAPPQRN